MSLIRALLEITLSLVLENISIPLVPLQLGGMTEKGKE